MRNATTRGTTIAPRPPHTSALGDPAEKTGVDDELGERGGAERRSPGDGLLAPRHGGEPQKNGNPSATQDQPPYVKQHICCCEHCCTAFVHGGCAHGLEGGCVRGSVRTWVSGFEPVGGGPVIIAVYFCLPLCRPRSCLAQRTTTSSCCLKAVRTAVRSATV